VCCINSQKANYRCSIIIIIIITIVKLAVSNLIWNPEHQYSFTVESSNLRYLPIIHRNNLQNRMNSHSNETALSIFTPENNPHKKWDSSLSGCRNSWAIHLKPRAVNLCAQHSSHWTTAVSHPSQCHDKSSMPQSGRCMSPHAAHWLSRASSWQRSRDPGHNLP
jgi:hypothetical protein